MHMHVYIHLCVERGVYMCVHALICAIVYIHIHSIYIWQFPVCPNKANWTSPHPQKVVFKRWLSLIKHMKSSDGGGWGYTMGVYTFICMCLCTYYTNMYIHISPASI